MTRRASIVIASLVAMVAALGFVPTDRSLAAETRGVYGDATARFVALGVSKAIVIDFPKDIQDVLIGDKGVVNAVVRSKRRVYILGMALGQTNVFFFDANGQQIDALDIAVTSLSQQSALENSESPANVVQVYRNITSTYNVNIQTINCTPIICIDANKPGSDQPPGTQNINVTGNASTVAAVSTK
jgi:Flp pilus assembly secretin CpaC